MKAELSTLLRETKNTGKAGETYRAQRNVTANVIRRAREKYVDGIILDLDKSNSTDQYECISYEKRVQWCTNPAN